jgi:predicted Zn-dependent protease
MISFLQTLKAQTDLEAEIAGLAVEQRKARGYSSTHPLTEDRVAQANKIASEGKGEGGAPLAVGRRDYLLMIDGLLFGNRREYGFVIGHSYEHPIRRIAFNVPPGYTLYPDARRVTGVGPDGAIMLFEPSRRLVRGSVLEYLRTVWAEGASLEDARALDINGMEAATAWMRRDTKRGPVDYRLIAVRVASGVVYRFLFMSPSAMTGKLSEGMRSITYSFRSLDENEAERLEPRRIRIVTAGIDDSLIRLASHSAFADHALQRFAVLNGLDPGFAITPGLILKTVTE